MNAKESKNELAWRELFEKYNIVGEVNEVGHYVITSSQINTVREARLMTKFDFTAQIPSIFNEHSFSIIPISRGSYYISTIKTHCKFENSTTDIINIDFNNFLESIDLTNVTSESTVLSIAFITGILEDFIGDKDLYPSVNGRMGSGVFDFYIETLGDLLKEINVKNSQLEIDGGYESENYLTLIEAKMENPDDFLIRQLYYPYRTWENKVSKKVRNVYCSYFNGVFTLSEYEFKEKDNYNSITLVKQQKYTVNSESIHTNDIVDLIDNTTCEGESNQVPFPQADDFTRVIRICDIIYRSVDKTINKEYITLDNDFAYRQTDYYTNAAKYLGLIEDVSPRSKMFRLTTKGESLYLTSIKKRNLRLVESILEHEPFKRTLSYYITNLEPADYPTIVGYMKDAGLDSFYNDKTLNRRASSIRGWVEWILSNLS